LPTSTLSLICSNHCIISPIHPPCHRYLVPRHAFTLNSITRAFLIEEATIVKRVLKAKAATTKK
jgi:predicted RNA polymerase sigma factor